MNAQPGRPVVVSMVSESSLRKRLRTSTLLALAVPCVVLAQVSSSPPCKPGTDTGQSAGPIGTSTTTAESGPSVRMRGGRDDSGVVRVDGFELSYSVEGTGIPCLVINDAPAMRRGLSSELRRHFRFIFMNLRMNVRYDPTCDVTRITLDTLLDDIERVRREAKVDRVLVFGHSINGLTAYEYARKYPEHVVGVVMNGTPPFETDTLSKEYWSKVALPERKEALRARQERTRATIATLPPGEAMRQSYIANAPMYWYDASYDCSWLLEGVRWNREIWDHLFGVVMARYDISKRDPIGVPVFLSLGRYDFVVPYTAWDGISKVLPNITVHLFDKSGHWAFVEEPDRFDTALREWVTRLGLGGK